jgi:WD40 repeat protein
MNCRTDGLDIIDLDSPLNPPRHLRHGLPWLVSDVQWSPFAARDYWVVSTANQKALVWNLNMQEDASSGAIEHTLHGHTRAITDINFSAHHPDILATCAVDGYVHCWDLRRPRQAVLTFCDWFAGATQVKYNRQDSHILASSHDRWLRIWDDRKGAAPLRSINAHESKIYGVDWNRTRSTGVITCSLDKSIKFWDYENDIDTPERIIRTDFPVWRARHTPFGWGVLAMPQDTPGNLHLYERRLKVNEEHDYTAPTIKTFPGHGGHKVKEFLWRSRGNIADGVDNREFQLVSWGEDNHLRLQHVDPQILEGVGYIKGTEVRKKLNVTRQGAVYKTFRAVDNNGSEKKNATITGPRPGSAGLKVSALSVGMKKMSLPHTNRSHMMIRAPAMKSKDKSSKTDDGNQKQIGWMSGIKFTKQDNGSTQHKRPSSRRLSLLNPEFQEDGDWDDPESLHDEIIRIKDQLPKITFEDVNMDKRTVVVSMNGPWGSEGNPIYIRITISFPDQYPETRAPTFNLGKTSFMSDEIHGKLKREVQQIAAGFVARKQGCLEAALCYLLGEVDLESSTIF